MTAYTTVLVAGQKYFDYKNRYKEPSEAYMERKRRSEAAKASKAKVKEALQQGHKLCTKCNQELSLFNFDKDKKTFTGYSSWCKSCKKDYNQKYLKGDSNDSSVRE